MLSNFPTGCWGINRESEHLIVLHNKDPKYMPGITEQLIVSESISLNA